VRTSKAMSKPAPERPAPTSTAANRTQPHVDPPVPPPPSRAATCPVGKSPAWARFFVTQTPHKLPFSYVAAVAALQQSRGPRPHNTHGNMAQVTFHGRDQRHPYAIKSTP
jgi:hypothetical protein